MRVWTKVTDVGKVAGGVIVAAALVGVTAAPVAAAPKSTSRALTAPLTVGAIDDAQAKRAGNIVRIEGAEKVLIDGRTGEELARIPADPALARERATHPVDGRNRNSVVGNCGESHIYLRDVSQNDIYQFETGFYVTVGDVFDFTWLINIRASTSSGTYNFDWEGLWT